MHSVKVLKQYIANLKPTMAGKLLCYLFSKSEKVALQNMEIAFGEHLTSEERQKLMYCFASHILRTVCEIFMIRFLSIEKIRSKVELHNFDNLLKAHQQGKGILLFSAHIGNWEFAPLGGAMQLMACVGKAYIIRKKIPNPYFEKLLFGHFEKVGIRVLEKSRSLRPMFQILKDKGLVILTFDQYANASGPRGILAHFFGQPVGTL
jgi:KDO2-lipid IV(A) lauroyltransferase